MIGFYDSELREPTPAELVRMLRHLAGTHPTVDRRGRQIHDENRTNDGPPGSHGCGSSCWDNSVRAWEEDK